MAVAIDAVAADATTNATTSQSISTFTVGAGANRALVVALTWQQAATAQAVHWDTAGTNQALTLIGTAVISTTLRVSLYGLIAPTSGNKILTATWTGSSDVAMAPISFTGVNQTGGTTSFANFNSVSSTTGVPSLTVTSAVGNWVVGATVNSTGSYNAVGNTQWYLDNTPNNFSAAGNYATGAATVTLTATPSLTYAYVGVNVVAATGGAAYSSFFSSIF